MYPENGLLSQIEALAGERCAVGKSPFLAEGRTPGRAYNPELHPFFAEGQMAIGRGL